MPRRRRQHDSSSLPRRGRATAVVAGITAGVALLLGGAASRASDPCTISWDGGAGTNRWFDSANWTGDRAPGPADEVCIAAGREVLFDSVSAKVAGLRLDGSLTIEYSGLEIAATREADVTGSLAISTGRLTLDGDVPIASFRQSGGNLLGPGSVTTRDLRWTGGIQQGSGTTEVVAGGPGASLDGPRRTLDETRTLRIDAGATATWTAGDLELNGHARLGNHGRRGIASGQGFIS